MKRTSTYSFGEDSPIKFEISDKLAKYYNEAVTEWFKAQQRFNQKFGRKWNPKNDTIEIKWSAKQRQAWNDFAKIFDKTIKLHDQEQGFFHENDIMDDFLVKNVVSAVAAAPKSWGVGLPLAVAGGVLYGLLRRL